MLSMPTDYCPSYIKPIGPRLIINLGHFLRAGLLDSLNKTCPDAYVMLLINRRINVVMDTLRDGIGINENEELLR